MSIIIENELDKSREDKSEREVTISENEISSKNTEFFHLYQTKFPSSNTLLKKFKNLNFIMLVINIIRIIFFKISFIGCHGGEEHYCVTQFQLQFTILGTLLVISTLIISICIFPACITAAALVLTVVVVSIGTSTNEPFVACMLSYNPSRIFFW